MGAELLSDTAVDDEIHRRVDDKKQVVEVDEDVECHRDVVESQLAAVPEVLQGVVVGVGQLIEPQTQPVCVADDEDQND